MVTVDPIPRRMSMTMPKDKRTEFEESKRVYSLMLKKSGAKQLR